MMLVNAVLRARIVPGAATRAAVRHAALRTASRTGSSNLPLQRLILSRRIPLYHAAELASSVPALVKCAASPLGSARGVQCCSSQQRSATAAELEVEVDVSLDGDFAHLNRQEAEEVQGHIQQDAPQVVRAAIALATKSTEPHELSVVLCEDEHIRSLNAEWRGKDSATDVLSFPMGDDVPPGYPARMLGDVVISLETAARQAADAGHSLEQECRVLLVHGVLHLLGYDHELGAQEAEDMSAAESSVMAALGWAGDGLIASAAAGNGTSAPTDQHGAPQASATAAAAAAATAAASSKRRQRPAPASEIKLLACDMDGTLLDSRSQVLPSTTEALKAALACGVTVMLATGKARPAAIACMETVGLAGEGLVVSKAGPGVFLQGLAVHDLAGRPLPSPNVPPAVVSAAFKYAMEHDVPLSAFLGDTCVTLKMHDELEELNTRYFEPLSVVAPSLEHIERGPPVKKLLFMTDPSTVESKLKPHWQAALVGSGAETTQAVDSMLEVVPQGMHKWVGMEVLLAELGLDASQVMTIGDGSNDLQLVGRAGIGVAMGNAVSQVKDVAAFVTAGHDDDGVAQAIERFLL